MESRSQKQLLKVWNIFVTFLFYAYLTSQDIKNRFRQNIHTKLTIYVNSQQTK